MHIFVEICVKPSENLVFENAQSEVPGKGGVGGAVHRRFRVVPHAMRARCAAADPEGFAYSAAAGGNKRRHGNVLTPGGDMDFVFCMF